MMIGVWATCGWVLGAPVGVHEWRMDVSRRWRVVAGCTFYRLEYDWMILKSSDQYSYLFSLEAIFSNYYGWYVDEYSIILY